MNRFKSNDSQGNIQYTIPHEYNNLEGASVNFLMQDKNQNLLVNEHVDFLDKETGNLLYELKETDTAVPGKHIAEFQVTYADGSFLSFPRQGYIEVTIIRNIDGGRATFAEQRVAIQVSLIDKKFGDMEAGVESWKREAADDVREEVYAEIDVDRVSNEEVRAARKGKSSLKEKMDEQDSQLAQARMTTQPITMADVGNDVKQAMTGGSVAVVGPNMVGSEELTNKSVNYAKTDFLEVDVNLFDPTKVIQGYSVSNTNGQLITDNAERFAWGYYKIDPNTTYTRTGPHAMAFYDANLSFISGLPTSNDHRTFTTPSNAVWIRGTTTTTNPVGTYMIVKGSALPADYTPFSLKFSKSISMDDIVLPKGSVEPINTTFLTRTVNFFEKSKVFLGRAISSTNGNLVSAGNNFASSDFLVVDPNVDYIKSGVHQIAFYNSSQVFISGRGASQTLTFKTPVNCQFIRVTVNTDSDPLDRYMVVKGTTLPESYIPNGYTLTSDIFLGKSSNASDTGYKNMAWTSYGDSNTHLERWQSKVVDKLGLVHTLRGISGTTIAFKRMIFYVNSDGSYAGRESDGQQPPNTTAIQGNMANEERINTLPANTKLITIMGGTNDWQRSIPLGNAESENEEDFYGALNLMIKRLYVRMPTVRIVFMTPPWGKVPGRTDPDTGTSWSDSLGFKNLHGLTVLDYATVVKEVARKYGIPCVDIYGESGMNDYTTGQFFSGTDFIHPNNSGGQRISDLVIGKLKSIEP